MIKGKNVKIGEYCIIADDVKIGDNVTIGNYVHIQDGCCIGDNTKIEHYVLLKTRTIIGSDCYVDSYFKSSGNNRIGDRCTLRFNSTVAREVTVGNDVFISPNVMTIFSDHKGEKHPGTEIGDGCHIGTNAVIGPCVKIVAGAVVGSMAFVKDDINECGIYVGIPATLKKKL